MKNVTCTNCNLENKSTSKYCSSCGYELPMVGSEKANPSPLTTVAAPGKKNRILSLIGGAVGFIVTYWLIQHFFFAPPSYDKVMMQVASELNKTCPIMIDEYTRLDNTIALSDNSFQYNYTLVKSAKGEVNMDTVMMYVKPNIINNIKTNPDMKINRDHKTTMIYSYKDKNGEFLYRFSVTPDMYR